VSRQGSDFIVTFENTRYSTAARCDAWLLGQLVRACHDALATEEGTGGEREPAGAPRSAAP
jgi:hypothetical protein